MKKIVFFNATLGSGGAERVISVLSGKMTEHFSQVEVVTFYDDEVFYQLDPRVMVYSLEAHTGSKSIIKNCKLLRKHLGEEEPAIVVSFMAPFNILALLSAPHKRNYPVIVADRNDPRFECRNLHRKILRHLLYKYEADRVVVQTFNNKKLYPKRVQEKTDVIYNPTFMEDSMIGSALKVAKDKVVVNVARLDPQKNQKMLLDAFKKVVEVHPEFKLVIYGEGPIEREIQDYAVSIGLRDNVELPGRDKAVVKKIQSATVFSLSSNYEGMSNSMLEAMCIGLPIVSTKVSGAVDLIKDGENGLLVPCGDDEQLAKALLRIIENEGYAKQLGENASKVHKLLNIDAISSKWMETINKAIEARKK